jgi:uncharacterized membrane protein
MLTKTTGFVLLVIGIVMLLFTGFNYVTTEKVVDIGPVKINKEKNHAVQWSPVAGAALLISGIVIIAISKKKNA